VVDLVLGLENAGECFLLNGHIINTLFMY
jgi:hypothetical protein